MIRELEAPIDARRLDELLLAQRQHLAADDPRHVGPARERDHEDDDAEAGLDQAAETAGAAAARLAERAGGGEAGREQQVGDREQDVDAAGDERVDPAAVVAGEEAGDDAEEGREEGRDEGDDQRDAGAVDGPAEDVAAELVDAEPVLGRGPGRRREERVERVGVAVVGVGRAERSRRSTGAKIATRTRKTMKMSEAIARRSSRNRLQKSCPGDLEEPRNRIRRVRRKRRSALRSPHEIHSLPSCPTCRVGLIGASSALPVRGPA